MEIDEDFKTSYCGCCGRGFYDPEETDIWCGNCAGHIDSKATFLWDATFFSVTGRSCPYQLTETGL